MRTKYGKLCFDCTSWNVSASEYPDVVTNIKPSDFLSMMPKQLSILLKDDNGVNTLEIPLVNYSAGSETYLQFAIAYGDASLNVNVEIILNEEFVIIRGGDI